MSFQVHCSPLPAPPPVWLLEALGAQLIVVIQLPFGHRFDLPPIPSLEVGGGTKVPTLSGRDFRKVAEGAQPPVWPRGLVMRVTRALISPHHRCHFRTLQGYREPLSRRERDQIHVCCHTSHVTASELVLPGLESRETLPTSDLQRCRITNPCSLSHRGHVSPLSPGTEAGTGRAVQGLPSASPHRISPRRLSSAFSNETLCGERSVNFINAQTGAL